jgi:flagellar biosynthesis protein FlhF
MNVQRFFAPTARDALRCVKEALGADAIVVGNRSVDGGVEILALPAEAANAIARTEAAPPPQAPVPVPRPVFAAPALKAPANRVEVVADEADDYRVSLSPGARKAAAEKVWQPFAARKMAESGIPPAQPMRAAPSLPPLAAARAQVQPDSLPDPLPELAPEPQKQEAPLSNPQVMEELHVIRAMLERQLAGFAWGEMAKTAPSRTLLLGELLDVGFSAQLARRIIDALPPETDLTEGRAFLKNALGRELITLGNDADLIDAGGVYALIGPTGVGKTTTTAKLAARCVVRHGADSLALLTTDGYRIGAHEQLRIYGRILGVPVHVVRDASDLRRTLSELRQKHMVLIDTAGVGQKDRMVAEQAALLSAAGTVRRLLLLNATSRGDTLDDVVRAYAGPDLAGCIITKVDEAAALAPALDVLIRNGLECAYIANGQRVPEDLHLANRTWLLHRALRHSGEDSPHTLQGDEAGLMMAANPGNGSAGLGENRV